MMAVTWLRGGTRRLGGNLKFVLLVGNRCMTSLAYQYNSVHHIQMEMPIREDDHWLDVRAKQTWMNVATNDNTTLRVSGLHLCDTHHTEPHFVWKPCYKLHVGEKKNNTKKTSAPVNWKQNIKRRWKSNPDSDHSEKVNELRLEFHVVVVVSVFYDVSCFANPIYNSVNIYILVYRRDPIK